MVMQMTRMIHVQALELMLDLGNCEWATIYIIGSRAWILPSDKRATAILLKNASKQKEIELFLEKEHGASIVFFPIERG